MSESQDGHSFEVAVSEDNESEQEQLDGGHEMHRTVALDPLAFLSFVSPCPSSLALSPTSLLVICAVVGGFEVECLEKLSILM